MPNPARPFAPESRVWVTGASNLRRFTCRARAVGGGWTADGAPGAVLSGGRPHVDAVVVVPVSGLGCGISAQSHHLHQSLKAAEHPEIQLRLLGYVVEPGDDAAALRLDALLSVAGVERHLTLAAAAAEDGAGRLHVRGGETLRMSGFGVTPPRRFGGLLRVRDEVTVHWDVVLGDGHALALVPQCGARFCLHCQC